jgi:hypothetical protein
LTPTPFSQQHPWPPRQRPSDPALQSVSLQHTVPLGHSVQMPMPEQQTSKPVQKGVPGVHVPFWQVSGLVHVPALHGVPSGAGGLEQVPVVGSQVPAVWH